VSDSPDNPNAWKELRAAVADYGGIIALLGLVGSWIVWGVGLMPLWMILVLSGAFGMLGLLGFIGQFRASRAERFLTLGALTPSLPVRPKAPVPVKPAPTKSTLSKSQNLSTEDPKPTAARALSAEPPSPNLGSGSGAPPYVSRSMPAPSLKWTDYKEDYFYGAVWRWEYRPEMGDKQPRNIFGYCPDCKRLLHYDRLQGWEKPKPDGSFSTSFYCGKHLGKYYWIKSTTRDAFDGIRDLISQKLQSGEWEEVVKRQNDVRSGRI
jgi:hypothetical protein